ncbi:MAG: hypothetical protein MZV63_46485 [Marinilabiliales bacterium]|nr:hypothetical protein [Marinilabiliales bacterium]
MRAVTIRANREGYKVIGLRRGMGRHHANSSGIQRQTTATIFRSLPMI